MDRDVTGRWTSPTSSTSFHAQSSFQCVASSAQPTRYSFTFISCHVALRLHSGFIGDPYGILAGSLRDLYGILTGFVARRRNGIPSHFSKDFQRNVGAFLRPF